MRNLLVFLLTFLGLTALWGGWLLMKDPTGSAIQLPSQWIADTVFGNYFVPGLVLFTIPGLGSLAAAIITRRVKTAAGYLPAAAIGLGLLIWLAVQVAVIRQFFFLQAVYAFIGVLVLWLSWRLYNKTKP
ncbi:hypothetical protein C7N43_11165 [Sphingobacteriales bacterium UPWRP_1]|nr:hypothetical protein B6N25_12895 [Sphingobacteriales bacterium TSM_CSS]PSJ76986.1 hypothetical protein C7N43_11165 [Sphingobacteriales bacterium UPWRP_1]